MLAPAAVLGCVVLWQRGLKVEMLLLSLPVGLGLLAAWLHACPYHSRVILYTTAPLSLLVAEGAARFLQRCRPIMADNPGIMNRIAWKTLACTAIVLLLLPLGLTMLHIVSPWPRCVFPWPEPTAIQQAAAPLTLTASNAASAP